MEEGCADRREVQNIAGEYYIWGMPRIMNNATINNPMRIVGGPGVIIVRDTKTQQDNTKSSLRI